MKNSILWIMTTGTFMLPLSAMAHLSDFDSGATPNAVACMERALSGESNGTRGSMIAVGKTVMRRVQLGEGDICSVTNAPGQFIGIHLASSKPWYWRKLAREVARIVISNNLVHPFRQFRTAGMTSHQGVVMGGNVYFDTGRGGGPRRRRGKWRNYRHYPQRYYSRRAPVQRDTYRSIASFVEEAFGDIAR